MSFGATNAASFRRPRIAIGGPSRSSRRGFTLIELIVVLAILGLMASISLPAMRSMRKTNTMVSAGRQLSEDLALARARAISDRTTVHMIFVPPDIMGWTFSTLAGPEGDRDRRLGARLKSGQFVSYALYADRTVGDQPGHPQPRYLTSWRALPDGIFIAQEKFVNDPARMASPDDYSRPFEYASLKFPTLNGVEHLVPHVAFDARGRLVNNSGQVRFQNEVLWLGRGSLFPTYDTSGNLINLDVRESPAGNATNVLNYHRVAVDGLTGRARVETPPLRP